MKKKFSRKLFAVLIAVCMMVLSGHFTGCNQSFCSSVKECPKYQQRNISQLDTGFKCFWLCNLSKQ